ncbi:MAG: wax ester/triacylglycerol synthase family O-acyltransferase [Rhodococcus sp.]|nr:wax ester/triacylglycerol synthase family O-acyltransferase [Rhodococcus sp. (in: high G+C Gram-positive bacteria)]
MLLPMSPLDSIFLIGESRDHPMHVGGLQVFQPPEGATVRDYRLMFEDALKAPEQVIASKLAKRPVRGFSTLGQWAWSTDNAIDLGCHVRRHALPEPGGIAELMQLCSHLHGSLLDRTRPMWELHLIEGLSDGRFAVYVKVHHSVTDGVTAIKMLRRALSTDSDSRNMAAPWQLGNSTAAQPVPLDEMSSALTALPGFAARMARSAFGELTGMMPSLGTTVTRALRGQGGPMSISAPKTIFNVPISAARQFAADSWPLERLRLVAKMSRCTINDVVLAMSGGALRSYLADRSALPDAPLVAMVPVSLHDQIETNGNGIGVLMCTLGTNIADPSERLSTIATCMREGKEALRTMSPTQILAMSALGASPVGISMLLGHNTLVRPPFNVIISNVTGPKTPMYWNGARLDSLHPVSIPVSGQALNITCTSNDDELSFGVTGCRRAVPDLESLPRRLGQELERLENAVGIS